MDKEHWYYWREKILYVCIYLQPGASENRIASIHDKALKIALTSPPVDGQANKKLIQFIAKKFNVSPSHITLEQGELSRTKWLRIEEPKDLTLLETYKK